MLIRNVSAAIEFYLVTTSIVIPCTCVGNRVVSAIHILGSAKESPYWHDWDQKYRSSSCPLPENEKKDVESYF